MFTRYNVIDAFSSLLRLSIHIVCFNARVSTHQNHECFASKLIPNVEIL